MKNRFENLTVWQKSHTLVLTIYKITAEFPKEERYGLGSQLRRSASSIPANIVEGSSRTHSKEFLQFLNHARASLEETKYHLLLARDLSYLKSNNYNELQSRCEEIGKMLSGLVGSIKNK